ncbi:MAG: tyrosine-type recombinase/integrase, partial [Bacteroidia bacterium]
PSDWSTDKKKAKTSYKQYESLNKLLKEQSEFIGNYVEKLKLKKKRFYKDELKSEFNSHFKIGENISKNENDVIDFISFIDKYLLDRKDLANGSQRVLKLTRRHIFYAFNLVTPTIKKQWLTMNKTERIANPDFLIASKQIDFDQIDFNWMQEFHSYLLNARFCDKKKGVELAYSKNFIAKQIKNVKQFANAAVDAGYINNITFRRFKSSWEESDNIHLSWEEINKLKKVELDTKSIQGKVRNLFVFNCYLGLRYSDLYKLDKNRFTIIQNQMFLKIRMTKTDDVVKFPILQSAEDIMKMYDYKLPAVCEQIFNGEIKKIALKAGITSLETKRETRGGKKLILTLPKYEMISSHTGRRSFATNFYEDGVTIRELMSVTGHTTEQAFKNYVKSKVETKFSTFLAVGANR